MAEKAQDNAEAKAQIEEEEEEEDEEEEIPSDRESEEGVDRDAEHGEEKSSSPKKKKPKVTSGGMQIPEYWPWEEAKKLFITPDVVKADDMDVSWLI